MLPFLAPLVANALLGRAWAFLTNPVVAAAIALGAAWIWHRHEIRVAIEAHDIAATAKRREAIADYVVTMSARTGTQRREVEVAQGEVRTQIVERIKEVPRYVTPLADSRCVVPRGFVHDHDAAWGLPAVPLPAGGLVDEPSGIPLSRVRAVDDENAGTCRAIRVELDAWRRWYAAESTAYGRQFAAKPQGQP